MPILADALQDAGCDNENLLIHLRKDGYLSWEPSGGSPESGYHTRGCWVLDLVLSKD